MNLPDLNEFKRISKRGNLAALRLDLGNDLDTPVSAFLKLCSKEPHAFLLESAEREERIGRYSIIGFSPEKILKGKKIHDLLEKMRQTLKSRQLSNPEGLPNFAGGFVGFFGYESVCHFEQIKLRKKPGIRVPDVIFFLVKEFFLFDHFKKTLSVVVLVDLPRKDKRFIEQAYEKTCQRLKFLAAKLRTEQKSAPFSIHKNNRKTRLRSNVSRAEFIKKVEKVKDYIRAGDCIQVVLSQRFQLGEILNDFDIYRSLRSINPSPYMFYFRSGSLRLIGTSPELLVKKVGRVAEVRPIAGTRKRGQDRPEDEKLEENLKRSRKEAAEHLMLVDLGRNDLGRVCDFKSIRVDDFARVERYSHVMHLVSDVSGILRPQVDGFELLKATFPAGTVTGAPKIRAMEIIDELEPERRGPYAGCLGYFSFNQDMDMCITIRTIVVVSGKAFVQAGAGIVYDSRPDHEYEETLNKAKALVEAVKGAS